MYTTIDRKALKWPSGPWDGEPDKLQWQDQHTRLPCLAVRHPRCGHWCGYVGVAEGHPFFEKDYSDVDVDVHGGLTFADMCQPGEQELTGVCHVPGKNEPDHVWWLGFDCAHSGDWSPSDALHALRGYPFTRSVDEEYRDIEYVKRQCASLAAQLVSE